jgi:hypothetical protein
MERESEENFDGVVGFGPRAVGTGYYAGKVCSFNSAGFAE